MPILACFVWLKGILFNLLCILDLFSQNASSQLCFRLFFSPLRESQNYNLYLIYKDTNRCNELVSDHKSSFISLAWALLCLHNFDAMYMQSVSFIVLNSLQHEGCASSDIWMPMLLFTSSLVSHKRSSHLAAHIQESCYFLFPFSFSYTRFAFLFSLHCFFFPFFWRLLAA